MGKNTFKTWIILFVFIFALLSVVVLSPALLVHAQTPVRHFRGKVIDYRTNKPIPKAIVNVADSANKALLKVETDESGTYHLGSLIPGKYFISVTVAGYYTYLQAYLLPEPRVDTVLAIPPIGLTKLADRWIPPRMPHPDLVKVSFSVTDTYGRYVSGLSKDAFAVIEGGSIKAIDYFNDDPEPFTVGLVLALSDAASIDLVNATQVAFSKFFSVRVGAPDSYDFIVVKYNSRTDAVIKDAFRLRDTDRPVVYLEPKPKTGVFEACALAVESIEKRSATSGKALILLTDMLDNESLGVSDKLYRQLKESDVKFFAVGITGEKNLFSATKDDNSPVVRLDELTSLSGGTADFFFRGQDLNDYFEILALRLEHMYTIGFKPSSPELESNLYRIKILLTPPRGLPRLTVGQNEGLFWGHKPLIVVHP